MAQNLNLKSKMSKKIYDPRLVWPYSLLFCGPTGCGKTTWIIELLRHHEELCLHTPKKLIWIYGVEQPDLFETIRKIWFPRQCEFINGFPEDLLTRLEHRAVGTAAAAAAMAAALFGLSVFLFTENPLKCFIL